MMFLAAKVIAGNYNSTARFINGQMRCGPEHLNATSLTHLFYSYVQINGDATVKMLGNDEDDEKGIFNNQSEKNL